MSGLHAPDVVTLPHVEYFASAHDLHQLPPEGGREVAFAGRSNAGKSSAINTIAGRNRLAFVSKTPGRTQLINYFKVADERYLVDLPGYGFAKVPETERRRWGDLIGGYLQSRSSLVGLIVIMDIRHPLTPLDEQLLDWFLPMGKPIHILLTKADKLSRQQAAKQLALVRKGVAGRGEVTAQTFSSLDRGGLDDAVSLLARWLELTAKKR